jgi:hypothetical protein
MMADAIIGLSQGMFFYPAVRRIEKQGLFRLVWVK